jgi:translation initiation factor 1A
MPNLKGGSGYKKKKKGGGDEDVIIVADMEEGQIFGRVIKVLGNCNMLVYCEDARERLCHIRGKMRSRMFVHVGDIVIISTRGFEKVEAGKIQRGDICHKYDTKHHSALRKKFPDINPDLFINIDVGNGKKDEEGQFEFEGEAEDAGEEDSDGDEDSESNDNKNSVVAATAAAAAAPTGALGGSRRKHVDLLGDDLDIDAI